MVVVEASNDGDFTGNRQAGPHQRSLATKSRERALAFAETGQRMQGAYQRHRWRGAKPSA